MTEAEQADNSARIEELQRAPVMTRTGWARTRKIAQEVSLLVGVAALVLGLYVNHEQGQIGSCVNKTLAMRNGPNQEDQKARDGLAKDQGAAFKKEGDAVRKIISRDPTGVAEFQQAQADQLAATARYQATRAADDQARSSTPLGKC